ncbi:MAG TPA: glycosyltransferase family 4 protein [Solirubrobacterales bacterium]|jgi:glycosyltransferase involved in cell wall biosynthesis|nr:glycosyltransferase family 4 protein [Solirubrobacterales bacterium]
MRILMLAQSYAPIVGGVERVVEDLSVELVGRGHEVSVATLRQPGAGAPPLENGVAVHALDSATYRMPGIGLDDERRHAPPAPDPEAMLALRRLLRRERPDVVHAHNWLLNSYLPLDRRAGPALVLSMHDYGLVCATKRFLNRGAPCSGPGLAKCVRCAADYYSPLKGAGVALLTRASEPWVRRHVDVFLPVSEAVRLRCGLEDAENCRVVPNLIRELPEPLPAGDPHLASLPSEPFILYFGDVTVDKGGAVLAEAYRSLHNPPPLVLVGRCFLEEVASLPGVVALGPMPHRYAIEALRRSLFTVVPSILPETFGLVALETAAAGKPIIASDIGGLSDVVVDGETGLLVPPANAVALAAAIKRLVDEPALRERLGVAAHGHAAEFSPGRVVPQFEQAYEVALAARRDRAPAAG